MLFSGETKEQRHRGFERAEWRFEALEVTQPRRRNFNVEQRSEVPHGQDARRHPRNHHVPPEIQVLGVCVEGVEFQAPAATVQVEAESKYSGESSTLPVVQLLSSVPLESKYSEVSMPTSTPKYA